MLNTANLCFSMELGTASLIRTDFWPTKGPSWESLTGEK